MQQILINDVEVIKRLIKHKVTVPKVHRRKGEYDEQNFIDYRGRYLWYPDRKKPRIGSFPLFLQRHMLHLPHRL